MNERQPDRFVTVAEAMRLLGIARATFYRRLKDTPEFPRPFGKGRAARVSCNEIAAYQELLKASHN